MIEFHYVSLLRFGTTMLQKYREAQSLLGQAADSRKELVTRCRSTRDELETLKQRVKELERCEQELKPWKERESKIRHYLGVFADVTQ